MSSEQPLQDPDLHRGHLYVVGPDSHPEETEKHEDPTGLVFFDLEIAQSTDREIELIVEDIVTEDLTFEKLKGHDNLGYALIITRAALSHLHISPEISEVIVAMDEEERDGQHHDENDLLFEKAREIEKQILDATRYIEEVTDRRQSYQFSSGLQEYFDEHKLMDTDVMRVLSKLFEARNVPQRPKSQIPVANRIIMTMIWQRRGQPKLPSAD